MVCTWRAPWASCLRLRRRGARGRTRRARAVPQAAARRPGAGRMSYDAYRKQRFRTEFSTWRGSGTPFELQYFPLGRTFTRAADAVRDRRRRGAAAAPAGQRVRGRRAGGGGRLAPAPLGRRAAAQRRGGAPSSAPATSGWWRRGCVTACRPAAWRSTRWAAAARNSPPSPRSGSQRPQPGDTEVRFYALLESPRVTGAYAFVVRPGAGTTVRCARAPDPARAGGAAGHRAADQHVPCRREPAPADDYRPEVHDSDGLQVASGSGEWLWRPLTNPRGVFVTSFAMPSCAASA